MGTSRVGFLHLLLYPPLVGSEIRTGMGRPLESTALFFATNVPVE
jgi:hypothetical protein